MQELRLVLILVGALAIAALLFHGLWTSRKETSSKFGKKVDIDFDSESEDEQPTPARGFEQPKESVVEVRQERKEPAFGRDEPNLSQDPLFDGGTDAILKQNEEEKEVEPKVIEEPVMTRPSISESMIKEEPTISFSAIDDVEPTFHKESSVVPAPVEPVIIPEIEPEVVPEPEEDVIVINVHGMGNERFNGNRLFNSLEQNGLIFGDMAIYHRHSDLAGSGKVVFSTANMVAPGHFQVPEGEEFSTPGISFFLPLPCNGEADYNFKLMLQTAQLVASELGGNVLDEKRNMLTPNKIDEYKQRVKVFCN
ncbi:cell division protein ZipA [Aliivibrio salmonicida]|uniref:cell division protein ZipA n=1 Tax=Aliivibrio salmonicida TaxID=40269 RepID=UPI003D097B8C